jgi:hypothetical protein
MTNALDNAANLLNLCGTVAGLIVSPKLFIPGFLVGSIVRIALEIFKGTFLTDEQKKAEKKLKITNNEKFNEVITFRNKVKAIESMVRILFGGGLNGYLFYAYRTSQAVNPIFYTMGGVGAGMTLLQTNVHQIYRE